MSLMLLMLSVLEVFVLFDEPGFPVIDGVGDQVAVPGALVAKSVQELEDALVPGKVLVWRHGSAFPSELFDSLVIFLTNGGSFLYIGGEPFTRPVIGPPGARIVQPRTVSLLKELRLNQSRRIEVGGARLDYDPAFSGAPAPRTLPPDGWVSVLEPRLSDTRDFDHEDGTPGSRDAVLTPFAFVRRDGEDSRFPCAVASFVLDRLRGRFSGGRWVFHLLSTPPTQEDLSFLLAQASRRVRHLRVDPTYGCYRIDERPRVLIRAHRPLAEGAEELEVSLTVEGPVPRGSREAPKLSTVSGLKMRCGVHGVLEVALEGEFSPGIYRVVATAPSFDRAVSGFWIEDRELFTSGDEIRFDDTTMLRNGSPEPVVGTTTMSSTVHRKFLFEPNVVAWDQTFGELASIDINFVRTGIWSAYRKISLDPHVVDEAWLRALEAYYLTARRHGIPILFTFFSFVPETFGGSNPYFDPRALEGQKAYVTAVVSRFTDAKEMLWDLINEPSFASPDKLWKCRPHGDPHELAAFLAWLERRYRDRVGGWEAAVRARCRLLPGEEIDVPSDKDFDDRTVMEGHRPYLAKEFAHFAQDAFSGWIREMTRSIREAGSTASITVGQDEGGLYERPSPLFHHRDVDYTSIHTWWLNDSLLWDGLCAKAPGTPLLISETGVMNRELLSGEAMRSTRASAELLSRKIGYAFAAGGFGVVQWCYEVNPYMASDNEVAIGLKRVDGSYKEEHKVMRVFAAFVARNRSVFKGMVAPEVVLVLPSGDHYSPRGLQDRGTQRAVEILVEKLGVMIQIVPEYRLGEDLGFPKLIVLPACRGVSDRAWAAIQDAIGDGALLLCSGWFEWDDAGLPALRLGMQRRLIAKSEPIGGDGSNRAVQYDRAVFESSFAASHELFPRRVKEAKGAVVHYPIPIEWAHRHPWQRECYRQALAEAGVSAFSSAPPGVLVRRIRFESASVVVVVNETSRFQSVGLGTKSAPSRSVGIPAGVARMFVMDPGGRIVDRSHPEESEP